ncbi:MAG: PatB family C-S lyase [Salinivirgaceae bacterium]|nr:PatB family C-S lyase [Salinivirgaceae bacterium]
MKYDFDEVIDRSCSNDLKHCVLQRRYGRADLLPLWVADMDFATPPFVVDALRRRVEHPIYGYTATPDEFWTAIQRWIFDHHQWAVERDWLTFVPGVVKGIGMAINVFTNPGDRIIIQPPVYHPFRLTTLGNGREVVNNPLCAITANGTLTGYRMDLELLERQAADPHARMLIMSNPHNPGGIVWDRETLERVADICDRNNVVVISDEIHCDLALFGHKHIPFATVSEAAARCSITLGAPSKTFNIAGIVSSYAIVPNADLRRPLFKWLAANEFDEPTLFAPIATIAAFTQGEEWRRQMLDYVEGNIRFVEDFFRDNLPKIKPLRPQASFLVWLDCRPLGLSHAQLTDLFVNRARLALNDGAMFGPGGEGFMRLNVATPRCVLREAVERIALALK